MLKVWQEVCAGDEDQFGVSVGMLHFFPGDSGTYILATFIIENSDIPVYSSP